MMDQHEHKPTGRTSTPDPDAPPQSAETENNSDDVLNLIENVDRQLERIKAARQVQDAEIASLSERFKVIERTEHEMKQAQAALEQHEEQLQQRSELIETQRTELEEAQHSLNCEREELQTARDELNAQQKTIEQDRQTLEAAKQELKAQQQALQDGRDALNVRLEEAESRASELLHEVDSLTAQLAEQSKKVEVVDNEREQLEAQLAERDATIVKQKEKLELAGKKLTEFSTVLDEQAAQLEQAAGAAALVERQQAEITRLTEALEQASSAPVSDGIDPEVLQQHEQRIAELESQLSDAEAALKQAQAAAEHAQNKAKAATQSDASSAAASQLQEKTTRLRRVAEHLRRRHTRLKAVRRAVGERRKAAPANQGRSVEEQETRAAAMEALHRKREQLVQQREVLAQTERTMQRRWAKPRAVTVVGWLMLIACIHAAASWFMTDQFFAGERTASATIEPRSGANLSGDRLEQWQQWHVELISDHAFLQTLARRAGERRLDDYASANALGRYLEQHLTIMPDPSGALVLTLAGTDNWQTAAVLDVLVTTIAAQSSRHAQQRGDQAPCRSPDISRRNRRAALCRPEPAPVHAAGMDHHSHCIRRIDDHDTLDHLVDLRPSGPCQAPVR